MLASRWLRGALAAIAFAVIFARPVLAAGVEITVKPAKVFIEARELQQLNFEFEIQNSTSQTFTLTRIELAVRDRSGVLSLNRDMDRSGASPAIFTIAPDREIAAGARGLIFNPFTTFPLGLDLAELRYRLTFETKGSPPTTLDATVRPESYRPKTDLILPLKGRVWAFHGHDLLAHHRRWNPLHPIAQSFGAVTIFARYALDLAPVDAQGAPRKTGAKSNDDYYGWGAELRAPGAGVVAAAYDGDADDDLATGQSSFNPERLPKEPLHFYGNYVIVDHQNGEYSLLGHIQHASLTVKVGDRVAQGQPIAKLGASGSAEFNPHLHYELRTNTTMSAEGLPAYFKNWRLLRGSRPIAVERGPIDTGEFVQSDR